VAVTHQVTLRGMSTPEAGRRVNQLRHDVDDVYEIVSGHTGELREIRSTLAEHGGKLDELAGSVAEQGTVLAAVLALLRDGGGQRPSS